MRLRTLIAATLFWLVLDPASGEAAARADARVTVILDNGRTFSPWFGSRIMRDLGRFSKISAAGETQFITLGNREPRSATLADLSDADSVFDFGSPFSRMDKAIERSWAHGAADGAELGTIIIVADFRASSTGEARSIALGAARIVKLAKASDRPIILFPLFQGSRETPFPTGVEDRFAALVARKNFGDAEVE